MVNFDEVKEYNEILIIKEGLSLFVLNIFFQLLIFAKFYIIFFFSGKIWHVLNPNSIKFTTH